MHLLRFSCERLLNVSADLCLKKLTEQLITVLICFISEYFLGIRIGISYNGASAFRTSRVLLHHQFNDEGSNLVRIYFMITKRPRNYVIRFKL